MAKVSKNILSILLVITLLISAFGTWKALMILMSNDFSQAATSQGNPAASGKVHVNLLPTPPEATGKVIVNVVEPSK